MGVSIVIGGQYGSEGKGKVANYFANKFNADVTMRVGGTNSGHTVYWDDKKYVLKVLPAAAIGNESKIVIPSGQYINLDILKEEIELVTLESSRLKIDPFAVIITEDNIREEVDKCMNASIGSTQSGTGAAVINRIKRDGTVRFAKDIELLSKYLTDTKKYLRNKLDKGCSIVVEGTQGFGLSVLHSEEYPYVTYYYMYAHIGRYVAVVLTRSVYAYLVAMLLEVGIHYLYIYYLYKKDSVRKGEDARVYKLSELIK